MLLDDDWFLKIRKGFNDSEQANGYKGYRIIFSYCNKISPLATHKLFPLFLRTTFTPLCIALFSMYNELQSSGCGLDKLSILSIQADVTHNLEWAPWS